MERRHSFIEYGDRYIFDNALIPHGYHQLDSQHDAWYYGHWFNPKTLELAEYAEGDYTHIRFDDTAEAIGWLLDRKGILGLLHIDDWSQNWAVEIERSELEVYMSYVRTDAIQ
jgi:hypothetical protein